MTPFSYGPGACVPAMTIQNLNGRKLVLPKDLQADLNCLIIGFLPEHRYAMQPWLSFLSPWQQQHPSIRIMELSVVPDPGLLGRWAHRQNLRGQLRDPACRRDTFTAYTDPDQLRRDLDLFSPRDMITVVAGREGAIYRSFIGELNATYERDIRDILQSIWERQTVLSLT